MIKNLFIFIFLCTLAPSASYASEIDDFKKLVGELSSVFGILDQRYVEHVTPSVLIKNAIQGMVSNLDPHSEYLDSNELKALRDNSEGEFGGLGISIEYDKDKSAIYVVAPIEDTPAHRADIRSGDLIIMADGKTFYGLKSSEIINTLLKGKANTSVDLTIRRGEELIEKTIVRELIKTTSVKSTWLDQEEGIVYLRITRFQEDTALEVKKDLTALNDVSEVRGIVLDLTNNPGGLLGAAVDVSDLFLNKEKLIVYYKDRSDKKYNFYAKNDKFLPNAKVVALINNGSASAAEIVSGALHDHSEAILIGQRTFGKGSVQSVLPVSANTAVKVTTAFYYTPSESKIQAYGIEPDIKIENVKLEKIEDTTHPLFRESSYSKHLKNNQTKDQKLPSNEKLKKTEEKTQKNKPINEDDADEQLVYNPKEIRGDLNENIYVFTAINVLKGLLSFK